MSILDSLLGGSSNGTSSQSTDINAGTAPTLGLSLADLLHSTSTDSGGTDNGGSSDFVGLGSLDLGLTAPTFLGVSTSSDHTDSGTTDNHGGGLLGGLL
jgi:hypothetical protein